MKASQPDQVRASLGEHEQPVGPRFSPIIPDHELLRKIGGGSYGEVWLARSALGSYRAVKIVHRTTFDHNRPFEREFSGIQKFEPVSRSHEGLVDLLQVGRNEAEGYFYYVMELADDARENPKPECRNPNVEIETPQGPVNTSVSDIPSSLVISHSELYLPRTLKYEIQNRGRLPLDQCIQLGLSLTNALGYLHKQGLVHRDIKPSNIIFVRGAPKLADVGLVAGVGEARSYVGTEGFIPPEGPGTPQADLYSLGIVLYEMSTGKSHQDFPEPLPDLAAQPDHVRWLEFNAIIHKACRAEVRERYQSAEAMQADLSVLQQGQSVKRKQAIERRWAIAKKVGAATAVLALLFAAVALVKGLKHERTPNPEAHRLYELGLFHQQKLTDEHLRQAITNLEQAIQIDPEYVKPYTALVGLYTWKVPGLSEEETHQRIKQIAAKLLSLNPNLAEGHVASSYAKYLEGDWAGAEAEIQLALRLDPNYPQAHVFCCYYMSLLGRVEEAAKHGRRAQELDPTSRIAATIAGYPYITARQWDQAIKQFRTALKLEDFPLAHQWIGKALEAKGDYLAALAEFEKNAILSGGVDETQARQRFQQIREAYTNSGPRGYWEKVLQIQLEAEASHEEPKLAEQDYWSLDGVYAQLGETNKALELLEQDITGPADGSWLKFEPLYQPLRDEQRFKELLKRAGLER